MLYQIYGLTKDCGIGSGELEFEEFVTLAAQFLVEEDAEEMQNELKEAFRLYDKEGKIALCISTRVSADNFCQVTVILPLPRSERFFTSWTINSHPTTWMVSSMRLMKTAQELSTLMVRFVAKFVTEFILMNPTF